MLLPLKVVPGYFISAILPVLSMPSLEHHTKEEASQVRYKGNESLTK